MRQQLSKLSWMTSSVPYLQQFVLAFVNDFLIYSFSIDKYAQHLALVMDILESQQLYVNEKKCEFGERNIN